MSKTSPLWSTAGFENTIPIIDNKEELELLDAAIDTRCKIGIRIASEEEPKSISIRRDWVSVITISSSIIVRKTRGTRKFRLKMLHFSSIPNQGYRVLLE